MRIWLCTLLAMANLELKRTSGERRLYALEGLGTLRMEGIASRSATAEAEGKSWRIARRHFWMRDIEATDAAGSTVGWFEPRALRRGGTCAGQAASWRCARPASGMNATHSPTLTKNSQSSTARPGDDGRSRSVSTIRQWSSPGSCSSPRSSFAD